MNKKHIGGDFDEFLDSEGLLEDAEAVAVKRVIAYQIARRWSVERAASSVFDTSYASRNESTSRRKRSGAVSMATCC